MTWTLITGDPAYSSWSLRGWLCFTRFGLPFTERRISFFEHDVASQIAEHAPARTVPTVITPEGAVIWDSLAIAEELAQRHPQAALWPADPAARATARSLAAEMHSSFSTLRQTCPMNLRCAYTDVPVDEALHADLARLEQIWSFARTHHGGEGAWLCGAYSVADVFYAPVAARIATYGLPVSPAARAYVDAHLADPIFVDWRRRALRDGPDLPWYARDYQVTDWPGPA
jgi:glutathione S-transferase